VACACGLFPDLSELTDDAGHDAMIADGATGDAADAAADAAADVSNGCPNHGGPAMVRVSDAYGSFCVDATEVTSAQYRTMTGTLTFPSECAYKSGKTTVIAANDDLPVSSVDWCDAYAFCAWAGKRLCGSRNGTPIDDFAPANDPQVAEWFAACSRSGARAYPYGGTFSASACNGCDRTGTCAGPGSPLVPVGSLAGCAGGYDGVFDISGNVAEWTDDCDDSGTAKDNDCPPLGGSRKSDAPALTCNVTPSNIFGSTRSSLQDDVGFRCCANAL
jgi:formylglycine-generating enzyme required for sulfatase activity